MKGRSVRMGICAGVRKLERRSADDGVAGSGDERGRCASWQIGPPFCASHIVKVGQSRPRPLRSRLTMHSTIFPLVAGRKSCLRKRGITDHAVDAREK
eukprot:3456685-Pleurochrysis_carterae.AAC.2